MAADPIGQVGREQEQQHGDGNLWPVSLLGHGTIKIAHLRWHGERDERHERNDPGHAQHAHGLEELLFQGLV